MAGANVADGDDDDDEKSPDEPRSGSIIEDVLVAVELKQFAAESDPVVADDEDDVGIDEIEPL